ncbi:MAG: protein-L-isoaspartate(D-aspartate) O-methyltransferase [Bacteroidetes bacterium]|nr:protein-L-isoaspartate(D-aspartate) O-methyltransferase [Bacteroidota bacterium]
MKYSIIIFVLISFFSKCEQDDRFTTAGNRMVQDQIVARGVTDSATLTAMRKVPRHLFVPPELIRYAYDDNPLPIGSEQTISQPYIVAFMTELIKPQKGQKVLEVGTGSGYQAAVLAEIVDSVYSIEILPELAESAERRLKQMGYRNINIRCGDGYAGWPEAAPFDAILVTAAAEEIPQPLIEQLKDGGIMVIPVGSMMSIQALTVIKKEGEEIKKETVLPVRFVPLIRSE